MEHYDEVVEVKKKPKTPKTQSRPKDEPKAQGRAVLQQIEDLDRTTTKRPRSSLPKGKVRSTEKASSESESSDNDETSKVAINGFDYTIWENLDLPKEIKDLYQYIGKYVPPKVEVKYQLMPFIPDYVPAVGVPDMFLKVIPPESDDPEVNEFISKLGLEVLDEPCGVQSDPVLLQMKLRAMSTTSTRVPLPPPSISTSSKDTEKWITEVQALHANQPYPMVSHSQLSPDIDALMTEWPTKMEHVLNSVGFPSAQLDCSLTFYIELMCCLLDIPLPAEKNQIDYLIALNTLFNLYLAVKNPID